MIIFVLALCAILVIVLLKYIALKYQIRRIAAQIEKLFKGETEKVLDISLIDKDLELLAGQFNQYYESCQMKVASALHHEEHLKDMIANITHDLRTPLTVIDGHLQMLQKTSLSKEQQHRVAVALGKTRRMKELTEVFYDLTLLDSNQMTPQMKNINFTNTLMNFLAENAILFESKHISLTVNLPDTSIFVKADESMLERILQNLSTNAIRYTADDIEVKLIPNKNMTVTLQISNPISNTLEIDIDQVFERFYTGNLSRSNSGTGLGLAVVKLLADKMHGSVFARNDENILSVFLTLQETTPNSCNCADAMI